jgi:hypothetical protein
MEIGTKLSITAYETYVNIHASVCHKSYLLKALDVEILKSTTYSTKIVSGK